MKKYLLAFCLLCLAQMGCQKEEEICICGSIDLGVHLAYLNASGTDLLNPATTNGITNGDVDIYCLENGVRKQVLYGNQELPENFRIAQRGSAGKYFLTVFVSRQTDDKNIGTTYISFKNYPEDTLTTEIKRTGGSMRVIKAWVNGELKWSEEMMETIPVIK
jgi:hypothetical protein